MAVNRAHVRWTWIVAALAAVAGALLLVGGEPLRALLDTSDRATPGEPAGALLEAAASAPQGEVGPTLRGTAPADARGGKASRGPVIVTVVDPQGAALAGVHLCCRVAAASSVRFVDRLSDGAGRATFEDVPYDGSADVGVILQTEGREDFLGASPPVVKTIEIEGIGTALSYGARLTPIEPAAALADSPSRAAVVGAEVLLTLDRGLPLEVDVRTTNGRSRAARWQATPRIEWGPDAFESPRLAVKSGRSAPVGIQVEAPSRTVAPRERWDIWIHPEARRLLAVAVVRPEVDLVAVFPPEVASVPEGGWALAASLGGQPVPTAAVGRVHGGVVEIRGVPHFVGDTVGLGGELQDAGQFEGSAVLDAATQGTTVVRLQTAQFFTRRTAGQLTVLFSTGEVFRLETSMPAFLGVQLRDEVRAPTTGSVRLRVLQPSGAAASGAVVRGPWGDLRADAEGRVRVDGLAPDAVATIGGAGAAQTVALRAVAGETVDLEVRAARGAEIDVVVVDELERPLPFASLQVTQPSGFPWADLDGDVQRIDPHTDERGRRTLHLVEPGTVKVRAAYGSRAAQVEVPVAEGETARVRIVLPAHDAPPEPAEPPPPGPPGTARPGAGPAAPGPWER